MSVEANIAGWDASHLPPLQCAGCRKCCLGDTVKLTDGYDKPSRFKKRLVDGRYELRKGKDGNCIYLGEKGCTIQHRKPLTCRLYDCRVDFESVLRHPDEAKRNARLQIPPLKRGRELHPGADEMLDLIG